MKMNLITFLHAQTSLLKDTLPHNELFDRDEVFSQFEVELRDTFAGFEVIAVTEGSNIIIEKNCLKYKVEITSGDDQIKVSAIPYHNDKKTQFDPSEPIVVKTEAYDQASYAEQLAKEANKHAFIESLVAHISKRMELTTYVKRRADFRELHEQMIGTIIPEAIAYYCSEDYQNSTRYSYDDHFEAILPSKLQIDITFKTKEDIIDKNITGSNCAYHIESDEGIIRLECMSHLLIEKESDSILDKYFINVLETQPKTMRASFYDQAAVKALSQFSGKDFSNQPNHFIKTAKQFGIEPDREFEVAHSKIPEVLTTTLYYQHLEFDEVVAMGTDPKSFNFTSRPKARNYFGVGTLIDWESGPTPKIEEVYDSSPAEAAGLQVGDEIIKINNIRFSQAMFDELNNDQIKELELVVKRGSEELIFNVSKEMIADPHFNKDTNKRGFGRRLFRKKPLPPIRTMTTYSRGKQ